jgi:hypothetical protein
MSQISRPYQIALVVLVLAAATWFVAFGHHSSSGGSGGSSSASSSAPSSSSQPSSGSSGSPSQVYHGSAPGVEGLTKAIAKAHAAVGTSEANAHQLEQKSAQASGEGGAGAAATRATSAPKTVTTTHTSTTTHAPTKTTHTSTSTRTVHTPTATHTKTTVHHAVVPAAPSHPHSGIKTVQRSVGAPAGQQQVEAAVAKGKVALVLFWNPAGSNDRAVHGQVHSVKNGRSGVDVFEGRAQDVANFGAITRQVPVYGTPTILIIGPHRTDSLTGLQDTFSIEQAIREVRTG